MCLAGGLVAGVVAIGGCGKPAGPPKAVVRIDAAASISHVIEGLADAIERDLGVVIAVNAGASGILAQQIIRGDRADLFISADTVWMDHLDPQGLIDTATRVDLASNRLVLVGLTDSALRPGSLAELSQARYQPIAVGDPSYVPAGRYAMQVFESHGLTRGERSQGKWGGGIRRGNPGKYPGEHPGAGAGAGAGGLRLAEAPNVRAALAFVLAGQCPVGLVYASDAQGADDIELLLTIDPADHDPIRYPAAVLRDAPNREQALRVLDWLNGDKARSAFHEAGFEPAR